MGKVSYNNYIKNYIVEAFLILLNKKDFSEISVKEIVEKAGVGRATFYRNFKDKESVLIYKFEQVEEQFQIEYQGPPKSYEELYTALSRILFILKENKLFMQNIFKSKIEYLYFEFLNTKIGSAIKKLPLIASEYVYLGLSGAIYNITREWIINDCQSSIDEIVESLFLLFFRNKD